MTKNVIYINVIPNYKGVMTYTLDRYDTAEGVDGYGVYGCDDFFITPKEIRLYVGTTIKKFKLRDCEIHLVTSFDSINDKI